MEIMDFFISAQQITLSLIQQLMAACPEREKLVVVLGFSGGPDSMFLLHVLHSLEKNGSLTVVAAHLDHQWRAESHSEFLFCQETCQKLGIRFFGGKAEDFILGLKKNGSQEEFGRNLRRAFLHKVMQKYGAQYIALAHHLGDQQETFFIRLMRGTTLKGLTGIKPIDGAYIRPLLTLNKNDILKYLHDNQVAYLTDPSNASPAFLRNRLRSSVIPVLKSVDERFDAKFSTTLHHLVQEDDYLTAQAQQDFLECFSRAETTASYTGNLDRFNALHPVLGRRVMLEWFIACHVSFSPSSGLIEEVSRFLSSPRGGSHCIAPNCAIIKKKKELLDFLHGVMINIGWYYQTKVKEWREYNQSFKVYYPTCVFTLFACITACCLVCRL